ncbi:MAG: ROK family protein [Bacteroidota bacterium]
MHSNLLYGIDLGGTKIEGVVLDKSGQVKIRQRIPTEREKGYVHILNQIAAMVEQLEDAVGEKASYIGIGTPGTAEPSTGLMKNCNTTVLNGKPLRSDLSKKIGREIRLSNDANCFALAETKLGVVQQELPNAKVVFGVIMGTGVGGGLVLDGKAWTGSQGIAGEWGHAFLDHSGGHCYCGRVGCIETIISGTALERYYARLSGKDKKLKDIVSDFRANSDQYAEVTIRRLLHFFGKGIANIINTLDPDAVVLGGGLGQIDELYTLGIIEIEKHLFNPKLNTPILKPLLGDSAGVFGAAML